MVDLIGVTLNNYTIQDKLGAGGMGMVFRAYNGDLDHYVAVKVMHPRYAEQEGFLARFKREARAMAHLKHRSIVRVITFGKEHGVTYLMMDLITGPPLRSQLRKWPLGLPVEPALQITRLIAEGLDYAHRRGVLHLDLKPDNILLDPDYATRGATTGSFNYCPVICDFGLARLRASADISVHLSQPIGTPHYMSPEQCTTGRLTEKSDIYSLGIMFYEILTGQRPFSIENFAEAFEAHAKRVPPPPSTIQSSIPPIVDRLVIKMLAKEPAERPTANEITRTLSHMLEVTTPPPLEDDDSIADGVVITPMEGQSWSAIEAPVMIKVMFQGDEVELFPVHGKVIQVGRDPSNDLHLESSSRQVSKRHLEIHWDNGSMKVKDLFSTNKSYLASAQLEPDVLTEWPFDVPLHVGGFTLIWQQSSVVTPEPPLKEKEPEPVPQPEPVAEPEQTETPTLFCEGATPDVVRLGGEPVVIGRDQDCDMVITDGRVSKRHCQVIWSGDVTTVKDLASTNGTLLGGSQLTPHQPYTWTANVELTIGPYEIHLRLN